MSLFYNKPGFFCIGVVTIRRKEGLLMLSHHSFRVSTVPFAAASSAYQTWFTGTDERCISGRMPIGHILV